MSKPLGITVVSDLFPNPSILVHPARTAKRAAWSLVHREQGNDVTVRVVNGQETLAEYHKELGRVRKVK